MFHPPHALTRILLSGLFLLFAGLPMLSAQSVFDSLRTVRRAELYFAFGKSDLSPESEQLLDSFAYQLNPGLKIRVTAHTDSVGNVQNNLALSQRRATSVLKALEKRGLDAQNMETAFFGEYRPIAENATETGRQLNRRATLEAFTIVPMSPYSGQVKDQNTGEGIAATLYFSTRTRKDSTQTDPEGYFSVRLPKDSVVKTDVFARNYFFKSEVQRIFGTVEMLQRMKDQPPVFRLKLAKVGETAILQNLYFVGDQAVLLKTSLPELPKILKFMQINPDLRVEIAGHINHPGVAPDKLDKWETALSVNRAKMVYVYLVTHGIRPERMTYKGYANSEMLFPDPRNEAEMEQNRRVEIRVIEKTAARE